MAPAVPVGMPDGLLAGDSLLFTVNYPDYPASEGWALSVLLRGIGSLSSKDTEVVADGSGGGAYTVTIPAARTAPLEAGTYDWFHVMTGSGDTAGRRVTVARGRLSVSIDPVNAKAGDYRAQCEKDLDAVNAVLADRITNDLQSYMIGDRQVVMIPVKELLTLKTRLERQVWKLKNPGKAFPRIRWAFGG